MVSSAPSVGGGRRSGDAPTASPTRGHRAARTAGSWGSAPGPHRGPPQGRGLASVVLGLSAHCSPWHLPGPDGPRPALSPEAAAVAGRPSGQGFWPLPGRWLRGWQVLSLSERGFLLPAFLGPGSALGRAQLTVCLGFPGRPMPSSARPVFSRCAFASCSPPGRCCPLSDPEAGSLLPRTRAQHVA